MLLDDRHKKAMRDDMLANAMSDPEFEGVRDLLVEAEPTAVYSMGVGPYGDQLPLVPMSAMFRVRGTREHDHKPVSKLVHSLKVD